MIERTSFKVEGNHISALTSGDPNAPLALFLHGIPASAELWRGVLPEVSKAGWYAVAPDCPGYGFTVVDEIHSYSLEGSADLFLNWIHQEHYSNIWLVGHDIGGGIAQIMVAEAESLFQKLTLSNCATARTWPVPIIRLMILMAKLGLYLFLARTGIAKLFGKKSLENAFFNKEVLTPEVKQRIFFDSKMQNKEGRRKFAKLLTQLSSDSTQNNMAKLAQVTLPVDLIWALEDPHQTWEGTGKIIKETLPHASVQLLENAGHFLQIDQPWAYVEALLK